MIREIYEVNAKIIDANGVLSTLTNYPKLFDSKNYGNDTAKARQRAIGDWHEVMGAFAKRDDRQEQLGYVIRLSDGEIVVKDKIGKIADLFSVTIVNGTGSGVYQANKTVEIVANEPEEGKYFSGWQGAETLEFISGNATTSTATFKMPEMNITIVAAYDDMVITENE